jgi:hypothetical protein
VSEAPSPRPPSSGSAAIPVASAPPPQSSATQALLESLGQNHAFWTRIGTLVLVGATGFGNLVSTKDASHATKQEAQAINRQLNELDARSIGNAAHIEQISQIQLANGDKIVAALEIARKNQELNTEAIRMIQNNTEAIARIRVRQEWVLERLGASGKDHPEF